MGKTFNKGDIPSAGDFNGFVQSVDMVVVWLLPEWAAAQNFKTTTNTVRNSANAVSSSDIKWPDGATGHYTVDAFNASFPDAADAWHATYVNGGVTKTITQPMVTRDSTGNPVNPPDITIV